MVLWRQDSSNWTWLTFRPDNPCAVRGCLLHWRMFSSVLLPSRQLWQPKISPGHWPVSLGGTKTPQVENNCTGGKWQMWAERTGLIPRATEGFKTGRDVSGDLQEEISYCVMCGLAWSWMVLLHDLVLKRYYAVLELLESPFTLLRFFY